MNKPHRAVVRWALSASLACVGNSSVLASHGSAPASVNQSWPELDTVKALLRAEAVAASRGCHWDSACVKSASREAQANKSKPIDSIAIKAIYGLGKQLRVELSVNGRKAGYLAGQALPEFGSGAAERGYSLLAVEGSCVRLRRAETVRTVCLGAPRP